MVMELGFEQSRVEEALAAHPSSAEMAIEWLLSNP